MHRVIHIHNQGETNDYRKWVFDLNASGDGCSIEGCHVKASWSPSMLAQVIRVIFSGFETLFECENRGEERAPCLGVSLVKAWKVGLWYL